MLLYLIGGVIIGLVLGILIKSPKPTGIVEVNMYDANKDMFVLRINEPNDFFHKNSVVFKVVREQDASK